MVRPEPVPAALTLQNTQLAVEQIVIAHLLEVSKNMIEINRLFGDHAFRDARLHKTFQPPSRGLV